MVHTLGGKVRAADKREYGHANVEIQNGCRLFDRPPHKTFRLDVARRRSGRTARRIPSGREFSQCGGRDRSSRTKDVGGAIPSRGPPHAIGHGHSAQLRSQHLWRQADLDGAALHRRDHRQRAPDRGPGTRHLRALGRRRFGGCGHAGRSRHARRQRRNSRLTCVFVNNGVLRKNEFEKVQQGLRDNLGLHLVAVDATDRFLSKLAGVTDPETKRKIIGKEFIAVFDEEAQRIEKDGRQGGVAGAGHALSRRDRVAFSARPVADHQDPPQRGRPARQDEAQADRAAERLIQGRSPQDWPRSGHAGRGSAAPAVPGTGPGSPNSRRSHSRAPEDLARLR